jgi:4-amino-4-deoxy-L-arabinose transferase-like glycosyltransferase
VIGRIDQARPAVVYGLLAVMMALVFVPLSFYRLVDGDEGTYLLVSRLVTEGQVPYHDFHYPQMFLLPYVYGTWMKLFGYSWYGARLLSAILAIALGLLVYREVARLTGTRAWGALAVVLFAFTSLAFGWYSVIKTHALATFLLFAAYAILSTRSRWKWVASGLLLGLSVACRLYVIGVVPAFLIEIYLTEKDLKARLMQAARFAIGLGLALLPTEFFFLLDPETFVFNIVGSFIIRTDYNFMGWWGQKAMALQILLALGSFVEGATSLQFILLFLVNVVSWVSCALSRERLPLASSIAILLTLASHVPTPTYTQYFSMLVPFFLVTAVVFCAALTRESAAPRLRHLLASLAVTYLLVSPIDLYRYTISGAMVAGIRTFDRVTDWRLTTIRAVGRAIDREVRPERPLVISFWPGYFVETRATILPGMENHFALMFADRVTSREAIQFKLMSYPMLVWHIERHTVDVVVLGNWIDWIPNIGLVRNQLLKSGYVLKERIAQAELYTLPRQAARQ